MNRSIYTTSTEQGSISSVDNGVNTLLNDVALDSLYSVRHAPPVQQLAGWLQLLNPAKLGKAVVLVVSQHALNQLCIIAMRTLAQWNVG